MFLSRIFGRREVRSTHRPLPRRRPMLEDLEGRKLLSTLTVTGPESDAVLRKHVGADVAVAGNVADIQGGHIGTNAIQGNHIGTNIVGAHIGTNIVGAHIG